MKAFEEIQTNKLVLHPAFYETIREISNLNISLPYFSESPSINYDIFTGIHGGKLSNIEDHLKVHQLDNKDTKCHNSHYSLN